MDDKYSRYIYMTFKKQYKNAVYMLKDNKILY